MFGQLGKFDQRIVPPSDTVRITPYAINKAVHREEKELLNHERKKKKKPTHQETISLSTSATTPEDEHEDIFEEYTDSSTWVALTPLLANASMRHKLLCLKLGISDKEEHHTSSPNTSSNFNAFNTYQKALNQTQIENNLSFEEKTQLSQEIEQETPEQQQQELKHLKTLIPGLKTLIDAGYSHMPIVEGNSFVETVQKATSKLLIIP